MKRIRQGNAWNVVGCVAVWKRSTRRCLKYISLGFVMEGRKQLDRAPIQDGDTSTKKVAATGTQMQEPKCQNRSPYTKAQKTHTFICFSNNIAILITLII